MGKSIELLGLMAFNVFLGLILTTAYVTNKAARGIQALTQGNVQEFVQEMSAIATPDKTRMDNFQTTAYLMKHIKDDGVFKTTVRYSTALKQNNEKILNVGKQDYISNLIKGRGEVKEHETLTKVEHVEIDPSGKTAKVVSTNYERGLMPVHDDFGDIQMKPLSSTSYCEQTIVLGDKNIMQIASATCTTDLTYTDQ